MSQRVLPQAAVSFGSEDAEAAVATEEGNGFERAAVFFGRRSDDKLEGAVVATAAAKETIVVSTERERTGGLGIVVPPAALVTGARTTERCVDGRGELQRLAGVGVDRDAGRLLDRTCKLSVRFRIWEVGEVRRIPPSPQIAWGCES
jgi:hypothetical protein